MKNVTKNVCMRLEQRRVDGGRARPFVAIPPRLQYRLSQFNHSPSWVCLGWLKYSEDVLAGYQLVVEPPVGTSYVVSFCDSRARCLYQLCFDSLLGADTQHVQISIQETPTVIVVSVYDSATRILTVACIPHFCSGGRRQRKMADIGIDGGRPSTVVLQGAFSCSCIPDVVLHRSNRLDINTGSVLYVLELAVYPTTFQTVIPPFPTNIFHAVVDDHATTTEMDAMAMHVRMRIDLELVVSQIGRGYAHIVDYDARLMSASTVSMVFAIIVVHQERKVLACSVQFDGATRQAAFGQISGKRLGPSDSYDPSSYTALLAARYSHRFPFIEKVYSMDNFSVLAGNPSLRVIIHPSLPIALVL